MTILSKRIPPPFFFREKFLLVKIKSLIFYDLFEAHERVYPFLYLLLLYNSTHLRTNNNAYTTAQEKPRVASKIMRTTRFIYLFFSKIN